MKRLAGDGWFQMYAAVAGLAVLVSTLGSITSRREAASVPPAAAVASGGPAPSAAAANAAAARAIAPSPAPDPLAASKITPAPGSSSDLATYSGKAPAPDPFVSPPTGLDPITLPPIRSHAGAPPAAANPPSQVSVPTGSGNAPKMTLTGPGVGNSQGIVGGGMGGTGIGGLSGLLNSLMGQPPAAPAAAGSALAPLPAGPVGPPAMKVSPAKPGVFVVDASGIGGDTASLRDAAFSASDGDLIVVKPGSYDGPIEVTNKSVKIRGTGSDPDAVTINWSGRGAAVMVRNGGLELEKVRVAYGTSNDLNRVEPHGAVYATGSTVLLRKVNLTSGGYDSPPLIVEQGGKAAKLTVEDSRLMGARANAMIRGAVKARFLRVYFDHHFLPIAAWLDAAIELVDCRFKPDGKPVISAYEGATVSMTGAQQPKINRERGSDATDVEQTFGGGKPGVAHGGFSRDIFRRGRRPGSIP